MSDGKGRQQQEWQRILAQYKEGDVIAGVVTREIKGGLLVNVGTVDDFLVFVPASQASTGRRSEPGSYLGKTLDWKILKIDEARRNLVVSRRQLLPEQGKGASYLR
jgi:small subunit ribosomal protein S1